MVVEDSIKMAPLNKRRKGRRRVKALTRSKLLIDYEEAKTIERKESNSSRIIYLLTLWTFLMYLILSPVSCYAQVLIINQQRGNDDPMMPIAASYGENIQQHPQLQVGQSPNPRRLPRILSYMSSLIQKSRHSKQQLPATNMNGNQTSFSNQDSNNNIVSPSASSSSTSSSLSSSQKTMKSSSSPSKLQSKSVHANDSIMALDHNINSHSMPTNIDTGTLINDKQYLNLQSNNNNQTLAPSNKDINNNSNGGNSTANSNTSNIGGKRSNKLHKSLHRRRHNHRHHHHHHHHSYIHHHLTAKNGAHHQSAISALESIVNEVSKAQQQPLGANQANEQMQINSLNSPSGVHLASGEKYAFNSRGFFLTSMLSRIMNVMNVTEFAMEVRDGISSRASCMACNAVAGLFLSPLYSKEVFSAAIRTVCTSFRLFTPRVCHGIVESFQDDFEFIRKNTKLTRDEICAVVFGMECARRQTYKLTWTIVIPNQARNLSNHNQDENHQVSDSKKYPSNQPHSTLALLESQQQQQKQQQQQQQQQQQHPSATPKPPSVPMVVHGDHTFQDDAPDLFEYRKAPMGGSFSLVGANETASSAISARDSSLSKMGANVDYIMANGHLLPDKDKITTFVQITDIHIDPYYEPGTNTDCHEPLCCRLGSGIATEARKTAGVWGDYGNCDTPVTTLRHALNRIRRQHSDSEYWIWTGDISPHDIWNISKAEVVNQIRLLSGMVKEYANVPVFPVVGNHEAIPVNSFSPPEIKGKFSMSWLYNVLAEEWSYWLPEEALATLKIGGYYKVQVRKGFRIICLNTNYCARLNPWSLYDSVDPGNQLKWLTNELLLAEMALDKVHIIGHVPPDNRECTQAWLFNFIRIVDRFKDTILGQFYGHTHRDEFRIIYSLRNEQPVGVAYIGPSITPFTENNPAYRVYHQNQIGHLVDTETYYFNLTEANHSQDGPNWRHGYRLSHSLNMTSMRPKDWHLYTQKLHDDDQLFDQFHRHFYRHSDAKKSTVCRAKCKYQMLSDLRVSHPFKTRPKPFLANRKTSNHGHHG